MGFKCPHCSEDIAGAMSQETHRERLKAKDDENTALKTELTESKKKAKLADSVSTELAGLKAEIAKRDAAAERAKAFADAGIGDKVRAGFEALYQSAVASAEEGKAPSFTDWLNSDDTKAHPLLADHYGKESATIPAPTDGTLPKAGQPPVKPPAQKPVGGLPSTDKGAREPNNGTAIDTPAKLAEYFRSPEYRAMTKEEQKAETTRLQAQIKSAAGQMRAE